MSQTPSASVPNAAPWDQAFLPPAPAWNALTALPGLASSALIPD